MNNIGWAIDAMQNGLMVHRVGWNGRGMYLQLVPGRSGIGGEFQPFVEMRTVDGSFVPWLCSQTDLLARDWQAATVDVPPA